ncbi:MAG TPA: hypothetical protein DD666_00290 [Advenella kashmirensis]|uniref:Uncharacterized protein n=1 Tax=Advenella kashmirensis TaxID=310575 RepID=A0A356LAQ8_9BURK|nr:hypothetical protein [Advenella kashmirensis]
MIASGGTGNLPGYMKETTDISRCRNTPIPSQDNRLASPARSAAGSHILFFFFLFTTGFLFYLFTCLFVYVSD